jgi:prevent-host-death family protein
MNEPQDVSAEAFRRHMADHLDRVRAGESFTITRNGRVTARLGPVLEENTDDD